MLRRSCREKLGHGLYTCCGALAGGRLAQEPKVPSGKETGSAAGHFYLRAEQLKVPNYHPPPTLEAFPALFLSCRHWELGSKQLATAEHNISLNSPFHLEYSWGFCSRCP